MTLDDARVIKNIDGWDGRPLKKAWQHSEFLSFLPARPLKILDIGCGSRPIGIRSGDKRITVDINSSVKPNVIADVSTQWPFGAAAFDVIYAGHTIEHFYPNDRDWLVCRIYETLKPGGVFFFRVPHKSGFQATGWEHHTTYGTNGADGLWYGGNPRLPRFNQISTGVAFCTQETYFSGVSRTNRLFEKLYNLSFRLTDQYLWLVRRVPEVQFMLQRP